MISKEIIGTLQRETIANFERANITLTDKEKQCIEVADFGLNDVYNTGLQAVVYINTDRVCSKEMFLMPRQTCPEHFHPPIGDEYIGKEETFRCRKGTVYLYVEGETSANPKGVTPKGSEAFYTVWHEIVLNEGEQYTLFPNTKHWFQAGQDGAIISEFSTCCYDEDDIFTNPNIKRLVEVE